MKNKVNRIIIDTNLWISFLITKEYSNLDKYIFSKKAILVFSNELLDEFLAVTKRPKFKRYFTTEDIEEILETIQEYAIFVKVQTKIDACRDTKDNFLLSLSVDGNADYLLTGDKDLLVLNKFGNTKIRTISSFLKNK